MLILNYGHWTFWDDEPANSEFGQKKVTFDGTNKVIIVNFGVTELDFGLDVYSAWKEWMQDPNLLNTRYEAALGVVGGDPLPSNRQLGTTFFLENGWKLRTWDGDHILTVNGNVFSRDGSDPFIPTLQPVRVTVNFNTSSVVETIVAGDAQQSEKVDEIWKLHGLDSNADLVVTENSRTAGPSVQQTINTTDTQTTVSRD